MASSSQVAGLGGFQVPPGDPPAGDPNSSDSDSSSSDGSASSVSPSFFWNWLVKGTEVDDLDSPMPLTAANERGTTSVKKVPKVGGKWEFVEYHPEWTDPDYNPDYEVYSKSKMMKKRRKRDITQVMRPAILLQDQIKNPSIHALRWGIHPDGTAGRSFVTPTAAMGVQVDMPGEGPKGPKDFLQATVQDPAYPGADVPLRDYMENYANMRELYRNDDQGQAWLQLYDAIADNEEFQRFLFKGFTTDDLVEERAYDPANITVPDCDLQGPLHPIVARDRWLKTDRLGGEEKWPRNLFNVNGYRGEYSAWDDIIWGALQPSLHMVSKILESNHPYWVGLLDLYSRGPVGHQRDLRNFNERVRLHTDLKLGRSSATTFTEAQKLKALGYDSVEASSKILLIKLWWQLGSSIRMMGQEKDPNSGFYGVTTYNRNNGKQKIRIQLGLDLIFPLLVQSYSLGEKAVCSFILAATMLHELAHAAHFALNMQFDNVMGADWTNIDPKYANLDPLILQNLEGLGNKLHGPGRDLTGAEDVFFEDEPKSEAGFAFESKLFGGTAHTVPFSGFLQLTNQAVAAVKRRWPEFTRFPSMSDLQGSKSHLNWPATRVYNIDEALPVEACAQFFSRDFWAGQAVKYGWQAFKLTPRKPMKARTTHGFPDTANKLAFWGGNASLIDWVNTAYITLRRAGHQVLAEYLWHLSFEGADGFAISSVWQYEQQTWSETDRQLQMLATKTQNAHQALTMQLNLVYHHGVFDAQFTVAHTEWAARQATGQGACEAEPTKLSFFHETLEDVFKKFFALFQSFDEIHRVLMSEIAYLQNMVADYLMVDQPARASIWHSYGNGLSARMLAVHAKFPTLCIGLLDKIMPQAEGLKHYNGQWPAVIVNELQGFRQLFQMDHNHAVNTRTYLDHYYVNANLPLPSFPSVVSRRHRPASASLKNIAVRDLSLIKEPVLKELIEQWYRLVNKRAEFHSDTVGQEAREMRDNIEKSVKGLRRSLRAKGMSLGNIIRAAEKDQSVHGTDIFIVPENKAGSGSPPPQIEQPEEEAAPEPKRVKLSDFQQTPHPSQWNQRADAPFSTQSTFTQFPNLSGFNAGPAQPGLFSSVPQMWENPTQIGGGTAFPYKPFTHPYAERETTSGDVQLERDAQIFTHAMFGGQSLQAQSQHGVPPAYQTYREESRGGSESPKEKASRFPEPS